MDDSILNRMRSANDRLRSVVDLMRGALAGRCQFGVEDMRAVSAPLFEMAPLVADAKRLRKMQPELDSAFENYAQTLSEVQTSLDQMRFMFLARRAQIESTRGHLEIVGRWADTLSQTR